MQPVDPPCLHHAKDTRLCVSFFFCQKDRIEPSVKAFRKQFGELFLALPAYIGKFYIKSTAEKILRRLF